MLETLQGLTAQDRQVWLTGAFCILLVMGLGWFLESRYFKPSRRVGSWFAVRIVSALAAPLTFAVVVVPARATAGMEGLAVFYAMLVTVGPLIWFGGHVLAGRWVRPALTTGEGLALGVSGLLILSLPGTAFFAAQGALQDAAREAGLRGVPSKGSVPLIHAVQSPQRFMMPGAGLVYTQSLIAPPDVRLERVEKRQGGLYSGDTSGTHPEFCTDGANVHLMWSVREAAPTLRLHWVAPNGKLEKGEFTPAPQAAAASPVRDFTIAFRPDGFDPVVPVPRVRAYVEVAQEAGPRYTQMLASAEPGESRSNNCLMPGYQRLRWKEEGSVQTVGIMFYLGSGAAPLRALIAR